MESRIRDRLGSRSMGLLLARRFYSFTEISELPKSQSEAKCEAIDMKMIFYSYADKIHFHKIP